MGIWLLVPFVGGQLVLAVLVWVLRRAFTRTPDLQGRVGAIRHYVSRKIRIEKARIALERAGAELTALRKRLGRIRELVRDRIEVAESSVLVVTVVMFAIVTFILFQGDAGLMTLLNGGSQLFGISLAAWALFGPWVAASIFVCFHTLIFMAIGDDQRPGLTLRRARIGALIMGVIVVVGFWATLSGRGVDFAQAGWASDTIQIGLWLLTLTLALCGAFTAVVATTAYNEARLGAQLASLETLEDQYERHIDALKKEIAACEQDLSDGVDTTTGDAVRPSPAGPIGRAAAILVVVAAMSATVANAQAVEPQLSTNHVQVVSQHNVTIVSHASRLRSAPPWLTELGTSPPLGQCEGHLDVSASIGERGRREAAGAFARILPVVLDTYQCTVVRISAFSNDGLFQPLDEFQLPPPAAGTSSPCAPASTGTHGGISGALRIIYPAVAAQDSRQTDAACQGRRLAERAKAEASRAAAAGSVSSAVARLGSASARGACTALYQTAARAIQRSQHVVIVTDGASTCRWYNGPNDSLSIPIPTGRSLLFLLVPSLGEREAGSDAIVNRAADLQTVFPGATVKLLNEATPTFWRDTATVNGRK